MHAVSKEYLQLLFCMLESSQSQSCNFSTFLLCLISYQNNLNGKVKNDLYIDVLHYIIYAMYYFTEPSVKQIQEFLK